MDITRYPEGLQDDTVRADPGDAGAFPVAESGAFDITVAAGVNETNTIANPTIRGQVIRIYAASVGALGDRTVTAAGAINAAGALTIKFDAVGQSATLEAWQTTTAGALRWRVVHNNGATVA